MSSSPARRGGSGGATQPPEPLDSPRRPPARLGDPSPRTARATAVALARAVAARAGLYISRTPPPGSLPKLLQQLVGVLGVDCVLDVGANQGGFVKLLRSEAGYGGPIVSFEPSSSSYARLSAALAADPLWRGHRYALGAVAGTASLHTYAASQFDSLLELSDYGRAHGLEPSGAETVEVRRLADVLEDATAGLSPRRLLLKMDTQGFDLAVIEGAIPVLERVVAIQLEVAVRPIYQQMPSLVAVLERLGSLGYEPTGFFPVSKQSIRSVEFDCVSVRSDAVPDLGGGAGPAARG